MLFSFNRCSITHGNTKTKQGNKMFIKTLILFLLFIFLLISVFDYSKQERQIDMMHEHSECFDYDLNFLATDKCCEIFLNN